MLFNDSKVASNCGRKSIRKNSTKQKKITEKLSFFSFSLFSHCAIVENIVQKQELKHGIFEYFLKCQNICLKLFILLPEN